MDKQRIIMFYELCRLCLENAGSVDMFGTQDLVNHIYICTTLKVSEKDKLPQKICTKCYEIIHNVQKLRMVATKNDLHLRSLFGDDFEKNSEHSLDVISVSTSSQTTETITSVFFGNDGAQNIKNGNAFPDGHKNKIQAISVRKDIFKSSSAVSPCTRQSSDENRVHQTIPKPTEVERDVNALECIGSSTRKKSSEVNGIPHLVSKPDQTFPRPIKVEKNINASECLSPSTRRRSSEENLSHLITRPDQKVPKSIQEEKDFNELECKLCNKFFNTPKKLYLHQRLHSKNILCPLDACGKKFATKGDLEKHIRTHTGERPYQCEICERSFAQRGTLKSHRDALHGGEGYLLGK